MMRSISMRMMLAVPSDTTSITPMCWSPHLQTQWLRCARHWFNLRQHHQSPQMECGCCLLAGSNIVVMASVRHGRQSQTISPVGRVRCGPIPQ
jgi:hypothetical protein